MAALVSDLQWHYIAICWDGFYLTGARAISGLDPGPEKTQTRDAQSAGNLSDERDPQRLYAMQPRSADRASLLTVPEGRLLRSGPPLRHTYAAACCSNVAAAGQTRHLKTRSTRQSPNKCWEDWIYWLSRRLDL
jgi:hypothetical protein